MTRNSIWRAIQNHVTASG